MGTSSMFNPNQGTGGGGGGGSVTVIDNLNSNSSGSALSANQGRILNEKILTHEKVIASTTVLGHVKVDGDTITIDPISGVISSSATGGGSVTYAQAVLPTTIINQQTWKIPFSNYKHPNDLLIVTHNSTVVDTNNYSITKNIDGISWDVNIPMNPLYSRPINENVVFVIMVKGGGSGGGSSVTVEDVLTSTSTLNALSANMGRVLKQLLETHELVEASKTVLGHVKIDDSTIKINQNGEIYVDREEGIVKLESYQKVLPTTVVSQNKWIIPLKEYDPVNDTILVSHNTTLLTNEMYEIYTEGEFKGVRILTDIPPEIANNNVFIIILRNVITDGTSIISGSIIINGTVDEDKLSQELQDKINSSSDVEKTILFGVKGIVKNGMQDENLRLPFDCVIKSTSTSILQPSVGNMTINIKKSTDYITWEDLIPNGIVLNANAYYVEGVVSGDIEITKGTVLRLNVNTLNEDGKNLSFNLNVNKK